MGLADLHLHTIFSIDATCTVAAVLEQARRRKLDIIAITDHDSMQAVNQALELSAHYQVQVIPAMEISTAEGHLLAYEIKSPIARGQSLEDSLLQVHEQGGFCIIPHPAAVAAHSIPLDNLTKALENETIAETVIAMETLNGGFYRRNHLAEKILAQLPLAPVGGSDGHILDGVGRTVTQFEGNTVDDLKTALRQRQTRPTWHHRTNAVVYTLQHHLYRALRLAGWVVSVEGPGQPFRLSRTKN
jgi:predicted metal-dependent phosphoesterase TrpH